MIIAACEPAGELAAIAAPNESNEKHVLKKPREQAPARAAELLDVGTNASAGLLRNVNYTAPLVITQFVSSKPALHSMQQTCTATFSGKFFFPTDRRNVTQWWPPGASETAVSRSSSSSSSSSISPMIITRRLLLAGGGCCCSTDVAGGGSGFQC